MSSSFKLDFIWPSIKKKKKLACFSIIKKKIKIKINKTKMFVLAFFLSLGF